MHKIDTTEYLILKDYLDSATEAASRVRRTVIILAFTSVLLFSAFLNSFEYSWMSLRHQSFENKDTWGAEKRFRVKERDGKILTLSTETSADPVIEVIESDDNNNPVKFKRSNGLIYRVIDEKDKRTILACDSSKSDCDAAGNYQDISADDAIAKFYEELKTERKHRERLYYESYQQRERSLMENAYTVKVPFFGVAFDVNDLGLIGGIGLIIVLIMMRFSLRSYILSLRMGIKASTEFDSEVEFYEILASRQLFAFPTLKDSRQTIFQRKVEKWYLFVKWKLFGKDEKKYDPNRLFDSKSHKVLRKFPYLLFIFVSVIYTFILINDIVTARLGYRINHGRMIILLTASSLFLPVIFFLSYWCITKWREIFILWNRFYKVVLLEETYESAKRIVSIKQENRKGADEYVEIVKELETLPAFGSEEEKEEKTFKHNLDLLRRLKIKEPHNVFEYLNDGSSPTSKEIKVIENILKIRHSMDE
jgi:hypothetical protein